MFPQLNFLNVLAQKNFPEFSTPAQCSTNNTEVLGIGEQSLKSSLQHHVTV